MAFSSSNPVSAHSLWLQLRSTRRSHHRPRWRTEWMPVWVPLLLFIILALTYIMTSSDYAIEETLRAAQKGTVLEESSMAGVLGP